MSALRPCQKPVGYTWHGFHPQYEPVWSSTWTSNLVLKLILIHIMKVGGREAQWVTLLKERPKFNPQIRSLGRSRV